MIKHHPSDDILVEFSAGSLPSHLALCVSVHLQYCSTCRATVSRMQTLGGELLRGMDGVELSDGLFDAILDRVELSESVQRTQVVKPIDLLRKWLPDGLQGLNWRKQWFKLSEYVLEVPDKGNWRFSLQRISAGGIAPFHGHRGNEVTVVLKGGFSDESGAYDEGDFIIKAPGDRHKPQAFQNEDCICLTYLEAPVSLAGPLGKWIEKFKALFGSQDAVPSH